MSYHRHHRHQRRAWITVELLFALPALLILLFATFQFGVFFLGSQQVALAARNGALAASQTAGLPATSGSMIPAAILDAIDAQLANSNIPRCRVRLEHNVGGTQVVLFDPVDSGCDCGSTTPSGPPPSREYVRITVCVEMQELMPNTLATLGFDVTDPQRIIECSSLFRYELTP